jgi:DNA (cytosine-5)-methyltransferase 1
VTAYYNEIEPYAADWLRELIKKGHIADGIVDTRSIVAVEAADLRDFDQCHFFAGIGVWSHALRLAGWPDDQPVWTGSCPCQPFSAAGKGKGVEDERHLWPEFYRLIAECSPPVVFGEQVASKDGLGWLDAVHADLEASGYAVGAADLCAAGVGAPHIRQRLWFVGERLGNADSPRHEGHGLQPLHGSGEGREQVGGAAGPSAIDWLGHTSLARHQGQDRPGDMEVQGGAGEVRPAAEASASGGLADAAGAGVRDGERRSCDVAPRETQGDIREQRAGADSSTNSTIGRPSPTNGHWRDADWLHCRDGKWRPVRPGTFPLAHGAPARVGRLRAYGNAIVAQAAAEVIGAFLEARP